MITLREIDWDNWGDVMKLSVTEEQKNYIASNTYSLAQAYVSQMCDDYHDTPLAIYNGETLVGFAMYGYEPADEAEFGDDDCYFICRFMIDKAF